MATINAIIRRLAGAVLASAFAVSEALAIPAPAMQAPPAESAVQPAQLRPGNCYAIGEQMAAQYGGRLARAAPANRGGRLVCLIVVLVPGQGGGRPRRMQMVVPLG